MAYSIPKPIEILESWIWSAFNKMSAMWHGLDVEWRVIAAAGLTALIIRLAGRRWTMLRPLAATIGTGMGWWVLGTGIGPVALPGRALPFAALAIAAAWLKQRGLTTPIAVGLALLGGWLEAGMPLSQPSLHHAWASLLAVATLLFLMQHQSQSATKGWIFAAAAILPAGLLLAHAPRTTVLAALCVVVGGIGALLQTEGMDIAVGLVAAGVALALGRSPHGGFGGVDAACLAPLLVLWLGPRLRRLA